MVQGLEQTLLEARCTEGQQARERAPGVRSHLGNANPNHEMPLHTPLGWPQLKTDSPKCWQAWGEIRALRQRGWERDMERPFWETLQQLLKQSDVHRGLPYAAEIPLPFRTREEWELLDAQKAGKECSRQHEAESQAKTTPSDAYPDTGTERGLCA